MVPVSLFAAWEGIGESMKLDFYSQIEQGNYSITQKLVNTRLRAYKDMNEFVASCWFWIKFPPNTPVNQEVLGKLLDGDYSWLSVLLKNSTVNSTDQYSALTKCLSSKYSDIVRNGEQDVDNLRTLSSVWVYTDGSTDNSDYDIIADINKINDIIFIEKIGYNSNRNIGKLALQDILTGNVPRLNLAPLAAGITTSIGNNTSNTSDSPTSPDTANPAGLNLGENLATGWCSETDALPFANADSALLREIESVIRFWSIGWASDGIGGMYALAGTDANNPLWSIPLSRSTSAERSDFFHLPNCDGFFCIRFNMIGASSNLLGGWNKFSIESLLNQRYKEIQEISQYDLTAQTMTQGFYESTKPGYKFSNTIGWLRVFLSDRSQKTYNFKQEENRQDALERMKDCAFSSAWLISTDWIKSNAFLPVAYVNKNGSTTDTLPARVSQQWAIEKPVSDLCVREEIGLARRVYTESFSTDLNEIQWFTHQMLEFITKLIAQVDVIGKKWTTSP